MKVRFLAMILVAAFLNAHSQPAGSASTQYFAGELKKLMALNSPFEGHLDFSGPEAISLLNASASQTITITAPFHRSVVPNAKEVCFYLLSHVLFKKEISPEEKTQLVELICENYLTTDREVQIHDNVLLQLSEKDFTAKAKKHIASLIDSFPAFSFGSCAQLCSIAQIRETIPALWSMVNKDIKEMQRADIDVLASLARMGENKAAKLLCDYYSSAWNKRDRPGVGAFYYVTFANMLAFSLAPIVLDCLVADFRNFDLTIRERGNDYFWWPAQHLGIQITNMLRNYPYSKDYRLDPFQL